MGGNTMKQRTTGQRRLLLIAFAALLLLLGTLIWQGIRRGDAARVGIPHSISAAGAAMLLQSPGAQYSCVMGSTAEALAEALQKGDLDAALLPADLALGMAEVQIRSVVGYAPLVILSDDGDLCSLQDLAGRTLTLDEALQNTREDRALTLDEALQNTREDRALRTLLRAAEVRCAVVYGASGDPFACSLDAAARLDTPIRFSLAKAWRQNLSSLPPAGLCLAVRQDYLAHAGTDFSAFEKALKSAMSYAADKRKKSVAMTAAAGLSPDEDTADRLYPFCDFVYLTGAEMNAALQAGK